MVRPEADWTRRQLDNKRYHDKRPVSCCFLARRWDNLGDSRGGLCGQGRGRNGSQTRAEIEGRSMVHVQCLMGPLLWVTESEMSRKAERIRSKHLSDRDETSSDVIPFVSIFGRTFNLMVPAETQNFLVRCFTTKLKTEESAFKLSYLI